MTSRFFASFSLQDLIGNSTSLSSPGGGVSGAIGGASGFVGSGQSHYHKSESLSYPINISSEGEFDERELIESLRASVEQKIVESGGITNTSGYIPGNFNSCEFFIDYTQEGIQGRIIISGNITGRAYRLRADLEEKSQGQGPSFPMVVSSKIRPEGDYHVVAFLHGDPLAQDDKFHHIGTELIKECMKRIPAGFSIDDAKNLRYAEVWTLSRTPQHIKELLRQRGIRERHEMPEEYQDYEKVYFLNDVALRMYEEGGIVLNALTKVTDAQMPSGCSRNLRGPYIPK